VLVDLCRLDAVCTEPIIAPRTTSPSLQRQHWTPLANQYVCHSTCAPPSTAAPSLATAGQSLWQCACHDVVRALTVARPCGEMGNLGGRRYPTVIRQLMVVCPPVSRLDQLCTGRHVSPERVPPLRTPLRPLAAASRTLSVAASISSRVMCSFLRCRSDLASTISPLLRRRLQRPEGFSTSRRGPSRPR